MKVLKESQKSLKRLKREVNLESSRFEELSRELAKCQEHLAAHHIVAALQKLLCVETISDVLPALKDSSSF